jgi:hypothetical protein
MAEDNRNHCDSIGWMIGTIFIAASLTSLGVSFLKDISYDPWAVSLTSIFSMLLVVVWLAYFFARTALG